KRRSDEISAMFLWAIAKEQQSDDLKKLEQAWLRIKARSKPRTLKRALNVLARAQIYRGFMDEAQISVTESLEVDAGDDLIGRRLKGQALATRATIAAEQREDDLLFENLAKAIELD